MTQIDDKHRELVEMIPRFYDDAPEADGILYADAVEVERARTDARELLAQLSATTATWGLSDWERVLELPPRPNSPPEIRRSRILTKLRGTAPATLANMLAIVNAHSSGKNTKLVELPSDGTIRIDIDASKAFDLRGLYDDVSTYIPAHLAYQVSTATIDYAHMSTLMQCGASVTVYPYRPKPVDQRLRRSQGGTTVNAQTTTIYPPLPKPYTHRIRMSHAGYTHNAQATAIYPKGDD